MNAHEVALLDSAKRQRQLFKTLRQRYWFDRLTDLKPTRFGIGDPIRRHEMLMRWAIGQGPGLALEASFLDQVHQQMRLCKPLLDAGIHFEELIVLRQQSHALSLTLPVLYPEIRTLARRWATHFVEISEEHKNQINSLIRGGGLVLTGHSFFHNALGAVLGILGCRVYGVAAPMGEGSDWPVVSPIIKAINNGSEQLFGGGRYLYTNQPKDLIISISKAMGDCSTVVGLLDHGAPQSRSRVDILGWDFGLQYSLIARWANAENPIYFAMLWPVLQQDGLSISPKLQLHIETLKPAGSRVVPKEVLNRYAGQLTQWAGHAPWAWQGFRWTECFQRVANDK